jgi:hypothetical protein
MSTFKGGFPPIKYCPEKKESNEKNINIKERLFSSNMNKTINIRQILKDNKKEPIIVIEEEEELSIVTDL